VIAEVAADVTRPLLFLSPVHPEAVSDLGYRPPLCDHLLHRVELELAAVLPAGTAHRIIILPERRAPSWVSTFPGQDQVSITPGASIVGVTRRRR
jgi:hypothetical protein